MSKFIKFLCFFYSGQLIEMNLGFQASLIISSIGMFYYVIRRFFVIFGNNSKIIPLIVASIIACYTVFTFMYQGNSRILDMASTISSRIFVLGFLLLIMLVIEHIVSIWYKTNPRIILGIIIVILATGVYFSLHTRITNLNIQSNKIEKNIKFLLVSDIHVENVTQDFHVKKIIKTIEKENPDFVIIAGDLMNKPNTNYIDYLSAFNDVKDTPIFAVKGNHDVMGNGTIVNDIPKSSGIRILDNSISINESLNIQIAGIIDKSIRNGKSLDKIMDQVEFDDNSDNLFTILITHQPIKLEKLKDYPIDLEVAGHTHRGQFYGIMEISRLVNDYLYGEYKLGNRTAFVTQGIGTWGLPFRLGTQSEMVIINLKKK